MVTKTHQAQNQPTTYSRSVNHCGGEENRQQSKDMQSTILHQNSNTVCGIVGNTKSVNNVAYKSFIVKSISVNKPSSVPCSNRIYLNKVLNKDSI